MGHSGSKNQAISKTEFISCLSTHISRISFSRCPRQQEAHIKHTIYHSEPRHVLILSCLLHRLSQYPKGFYGVLGYFPQGYCDVLGYYLKGHYGAVGDFPTYYGVLDYFPTGYYSVLGYFLTGTFLVTFLYGFFIVFQECQSMPMTNAITAVFMNYMTSLNP